MANPSCRRAAEGFIWARNFTPILHLHFYGPELLKGGGGGGRSGEKSETRALGEGGGTSLPPESRDSSWMRILTGSPENPHHPPGPVGVLGDEGE